MQPINKIQIYDYVFIGAGASTILLLLSLERNALLENKNLGKCQLIFSHLATHVTIQGH